MIGSYVTTVPSVTSRIQTDSQILSIQSDQSLHQGHIGLSEEESRPKTDESATVAYHSPFVIN